METKKRIRWVLKGIILAIIVAIFYFMNDEISGLQSAVQQRDKLIFQMNKMDSNYSSKTKKYSEIISRYVNDCNFYIDDKKISASDFVKLTNELIRENERLKDSVYDAKSFYRDDLDQANDSLRTLSKIVELVQRDYGISYTVSYEGDYKLFYRNPSRADSAMVLFPYYKNKLSYDSISKAWKIELQKTKEIMPNDEDKRKKKMK